MNKSSLGEERVYLNIQVNTPSLSQDRAETQSRSLCINHGGIMLAGLPKTLMLRYLVQAGDAATYSELDPL